MLNALLLDLGADRKHLEEALKTISLDGYHLHVDRIAKSSIWGTDFDVHMEHGEKTMASLVTLIITITTTGMAMNITTNTNMNIHMLIHIRTKNTHMHTHSHEHTHEHLH